MLNITYEEARGVQSQWIDTHEAKPYKIKPCWFIDVNEVTVAKAKTLKEAKGMLSHYPNGELRCYNPTQEERGLELKESRRLTRNNWGIM